MSLRRWALLLSALSVAAVSTAQSADVPLTNWTVPPYRAASASGDFSTMVDISPGIGFVAMQPCRIVDTRGGGVFTGAYGPPIMAAGATRSFDLNSSPHCTGIPALVEAYSLNFTVTQTAGAVGDIRAWPTGSPPVQLTSVLNWTVVGATLANATIIPAGTGGSIDVQVAGSDTHLLIDINGYFTEEYNPGVSFEASSTTVAPAILANNSSNAGGATAIQGIIKSVTPGAFSAGVLGQNNGTGPLGIGVWGIQSGSGFGVHGTTVNGWGVFGRTSSGSGRHFGVVGQTSSSSDGASGVLGFAGLRTDEEEPPTPSAVVPKSPSVVFIPSRAGVRGESRSSIGALGVTHNGVGVQGAITSLTSGSIVLSGNLADFAGGAIYAVHSIGDTHVAGDLSVTGTKAFVQPHPTDPSKEIRYIALEGPRSEIYFRGSAQVSRGVTRIEVPEYFRLVAARDSYSALVTPVGAMATVAVLAKGEDGIVVEASRDVKIDYVVYAERETTRQANPVVENRNFRSRPDMGHLQHLPESYRQMMIRNGTLNLDGSINMETARRLGWDKEWEKRDPPAPQLAPE